MNNQLIKQALGFLVTNNFDNYFQSMDQASLPQSKQQDYETLKTRFLQEGALATKPLLKQFAQDLLKASMLTLIKWLIGILLLAGLVWKIYPMVTGGSEKFIGIRGYFVDKASRKRITLSGTIFIKGQPQTETKLNSQGGFTLTKVRIVKSDPLEYRVEFNGYEPVGCPANLSYTQANDGVYDVGEIIIDMPAKEKKKPKPQTGNQGSNNASTTTDESTRELRPKPKPTAETTHEWQCLARPGIVVSATINGQPCIDTANDQGIAVLRFKGKTPSENVQITFSKTGKPNQSCSDHYAYGTTPKLSNINFCSLNNQ